MMLAGCEPQGAKARGEAWEVWGSCPWKAHLHVGWSEPRPASHQLVVPSWEKVKTGKKNGDSFSSSREEKHKKRPEMVKAACKGLDDV